MKLLLLPRIAALALTFVLVGCNGEQKPTPTVPSANAAAPTNAALSAPAPVLPGEVLNNVPVTEADIAWQAVEKALQPPEYPEEWSLEKPTKEQIAEFERKNSQLAAAAAYKSREFYTKYPQHQNASEAREQEYKLLNVAV